MTFQRKHSDIMIKGGPIEIRAETVERTVRSVKNRKGNGPNGITEKWQTITVNKNECNNII